MLEVAKALDLTTADDFRAAVADGRLRTVPGIGATTEARMRVALEEPARPRKGLTLNRGRSLAQAVADSVGGVVAGDPRRSCELSFDLGVISSAGRPGPVLDSFARLPQIVAIVERTERQATGVTVEGVPLTLVVADPPRLGTELIRATGSADYVESLGPLPDASTEEAVYGSLGLPWVPPEVRELPAPWLPMRLLELEDIRGDLHCHTAWSDGRATVEEMGRAGRDRGYDYLAICDHTTNVRVVPGLTGDDVRRQSDEIAAANETLAPFRVVRGIECDILPDGSLDLEDAVLAELDWVQISLHAGQRRLGPELTRIVCEAMRNPFARALSHPKGRS